MHDIIWAAITVGKRNKAQITKHGIYSIYEIINRSTLVWTSLKLSSDRLIKTDVYNEMDPTEKVFVSFSLGMTMSKLFSLKLLRVPWLEHVSNISNTLKTRTATKSRPDLIGVNYRNDFVIVEAKGRTNDFNDAAQNVAKTQTKVIKTIDGKSPVLRVASQSFFNDYLEVYFEDPEDTAEEAIHVETSLNDYFGSYYRHFRHMSPRDLKLLKLIGIEIKLSDFLVDAFKNNRFDNIAKETKGEYFDNNGFKQFPDGISIKLDEKLWSSEAMSLEPEKRNHTDN